MDLGTEKHIYKGLLDDHNEARILAVDWRWNRFGFAILKKPLDLLDFGTRSIPTAAAKSVVVSRIEGVVDQGRPDVVIVRRLSARNHGRTITTAMFTRWLMHVLEPRSIPLEIISDRDVLRLFSRYQALSTYAIASVIADRFPEVGWKLAPDRSWSSEHHNLVIFEAIAIAVTYISGLPSENNNGEF